MTAKIIALSGANGLVGSELSSALKKAGFEVWPMVRTKYATGPGQIAYDYQHNFIESEKLKQCHAVIHLAGKNIMSGLWTKKFKEELYDSRVLSTKLIADAMATAGPQLFLHASAIGIYGDQGSIKLDETAPLANDFLATLCKDWEGATNNAERAGVRVVHLRFGHIMSRDGGMLKKLSPLVKAGIFGKLGSGQQYMSLVAIEDVIAAILFALEHTDIKGPINVVAPEPIPNKEFTELLGLKFNRPAFFHVPTWALKLLGEQASILLCSTRVVPKLLLEKGFVFKRVNFQEMLKDF